MAEMTGRKGGLIKEGDKYVYKDRKQLVCMQLARWRWVNRNLCWATRAWYTPCEMY